MVTAFGSDNRCFTAVSHAAAFTRVLHSKAFSLIDRISGMPIKYVQRNCGGMAAK
jgi:hypothetical protein